MSGHGRRPARCVMVLGTNSGAGKSLLATALCRWYARQGLSVAPFKAQNMSNNARVVAAAVHEPAPRAGDPDSGERDAVDVAPSADGVPCDQGVESRDAPMRSGEIGSAQYFQALAARAVPEVRMNPVLLKPERDDASQVVLLGRADAALSAMPWRQRSERLWPVVTQSLDALRAAHDVVVIEGAGSPAEINLMTSDIVNLRVARHADARCLLICDIDRGGAFAHLYGTWSLLPEVDRARLAGFVLNKFRGDAALLAPGPEQLQQLTGVPTLATLPMWRGHGLPEEDGVFGALQGNAVEGGELGTTVVAVIAWPRISNLDEFHPLTRVPGIVLRWARSAGALGGADWIVLPGSKATSADLAWLRAQGMDRAVADHAACGGAVLGLCGGLQMLGEALIDPHGIDGNAAGLGLLPIVTVFERDKTVRRRHVRFFDLPGGPWRALSGVELAGYEIHHGRSAAHPQLAAAGQRALPALPNDLGWRNEAGNVLGLYLHGLFEDAAVLRALFGAQVPTLDSVFEGLADFVDGHFAPGVLAALIG